MHLAYFVIKCSVAYNSPLLAMIFLIKDHDLDHVLQKDLLWPENAFFSKFFSDLIWFIIDHLFE